MSAPVDPITVAHARAAFAGQVVTDSRVATRLRLTAAYLTARGYEAEQMTDALMVVAEEVSASFHIEDEIHAERAISEGISDGLARVEEIAALELPEPIGVDR